MGLVGGDVGANLGTHLGTAPAGGLAGPALVGEMPRCIGVDGQARVDRGHLLSLGGGLLDRGSHLGGWGAAGKNDGGEGQDVTYAWAGLQLRPGRRRQETRWHRYSRVMVPGVF